MVIAGLMGVALVLSLYRLATNPEGRYHTDPVNLSDLSYLELKDGVVTFIQVKGRDLSSGEGDERAHYVKESGHWVGYDNNNSEKVFLETGVLSLKIRDTNGVIQIEFPRMWAIGNKVVRFYKP